MFTIPILKFITTACIENRLPIFNKYCAFEKRKNFTPVCHLFRSTVIRTAQIFD